MQQSTSLSIYTLCPCPYTLVLLVQVYLQIKFLEWDISFEAHKITWSIVFLCNLETSFLIYVFNRVFSGSLATCKPHNGSQQKKGTQKIEMRQNAEAMRAQVAGGKNGCVSSFPALVGQLCCLLQRRGERCKTREMCSLRAVENGFSFTCKKRLRKCQKICGTCFPSKRKKPCIIFLMI